MRLEHNKERAEFIRVVLLQTVSDVHFFERNRIMDYSLLVCNIFHIPLQPPSFTLRSLRLLHIEYNFIIRCAIDRCLHYYTCPRLACHRPLAGQRPVLRGPLHRHRPSQAQGGARLLRVFKTPPYYSVRWCCSGSGPCVLFVPCLRGYLYLSGLCVCRPVPS